MDEAARPGEAVGGETKHTLVLDKDGDQSRSAVNQGERRPRTSRLARCLRLEPNQAGEGQILEETPERLKRQQRLCRLPTGGRHLGVNHNSQWLANLKSCHSLSSRLSG